MGNYLQVFSCPRYLERFAYKHALNVAVLKKVYIIWELKKIVCQGGKWNNFSNIFSLSKKKAVEAAWHICAICLENDIAETSVRNQFSSLKERYLTWAIFHVQEKIHVS